MKIIFYTDGACSGNPGPMGVGIVGICGNKRKEWSIPTGQGTNNQAELLAILNALKLVKSPPEQTEIEIYCDSQWAINAVLGTYKIKANSDLVKQIKDEIQRFKSVKFSWVRGHNGHPENERANQLAQKATGNI